jgi:hypothetical protein
LRLAKSDGVSSAGAAAAFVSLAGPDLCGTKAKKLVRNREKDSISHRKSPWIFLHENTQFFAEKA